jgi:hypothetical protein
MKGEMEMVCRVVGVRLYLEKLSMEDIHKVFSELEEVAPSLELDTVEVESEDKYLDREYALRKIGIRSAS